MCIIHIHTEVSPDLTQLYRCIHIWWKTAREESKLIFYEEEREIYNVTVRGVNYYRLQTDSEWLKGVSDKSDITVEVTVEGYSYTLLNYLHRLPREWIQKRTRQVVDLFAFAFLV